jgi:hypothetical protein
MSKLKSRATMFVAAVAVVATSLVGIVVPAQPASAAEVSGCHLIGCVFVNTGAKNYSNHTQSVETISMGGYGFLETWGNGFYQTAYGNSHTWGIGRWVASGTYVCGAVSVPGVPRRIACIYISV